MLDNVRKSVLDLLKQDKSGHDSNHVIRVYNLALRFAEQENSNKYIVGLAALLHDVDDYKIVGKQNSKKLENAIRIMNNSNINFDIQTRVLNIIKTMGYSNYLKGIRPSTIEGKIVSDADMCDAIGANGIIRSIVYSVSDKGNGIIFDKNIYPNIDITYKEYNSNQTNTTHNTDSAINHFFEKSLKLSNLMLTKSGQQESINREKIIIDFLKQFFQEEGVPEWESFLDMYLKKEKNKTLTFKL